MSGDILTLRTVAGYEIGISYALPMVLKAIAEIGFS
jgi:hypothetical protein